MYSSTRKDLYNAEVFFALYCYLKRLDIVIETFGYRLLRHLDIVIGTFGKFTFMNIFGFVDNLLIT